MAVSPETSNATLLLSRGELYFDQFEDGTTTRTGERYLGNTPGFSLSRALEQTERARSYGGLIVPIRSVITKETITAKMQTDNIDAPNLMAWLGAEVSVESQSAQTDVTETFTVKRGCWYQLGETVYAAGLRALADTPTFTKSGTAVTLAGNIVVDSANARFLVKSTATDVASGDTLSVTFSVEDSDTGYIDSQSKPTELVGALRFISTGEIGVGANYFFPYVVLKPSSEMDLKKDDWLTLDFEIEVRKLNPESRHFYATRIGLTAEGKTSTLFPVVTISDAVIVTDGPEASIGNAVIVEVEDTGLTFSPTSVTFDTTTVGEETETTITVTNSGTTDVTVSAITVTGDEFSVVQFST